MNFSEEEKALLQRFIHQGKEPVSCRDKYAVAMGLVEKGVLEYALFGAFRLADPKYLVTENVTNTEQVTPINNKTKLASLIDAGAETVGCVPVEEWLAYTRDLCLKVASDDAANEEMHWKKYWLDAADNIQQALEQVEKALSGNEK